MARSCKDLIYSILTEMKEQSFEEFKVYLNDECILKPYQHIPVAELERAKRIDVPDLLIRRYQQQGALEVTLNLEAIKESNLAEKLRSEVRSLRFKEECAMEQNI
ncbi:pyrin-like [Lithobates pipiens]